MNPRHVICTLLSAAALALPSVAHADPNDPTNYTPAPAEAPVKPPTQIRPERFSLHVAPVFFVPIGSLADATLLGGGGLIGMDYQLSPRFVLTGRGGYIATFEQSQPANGFTVQSNINFAPFLGGLKWYLTEDSGGLFVSLEAGPVLAIGSSHLVGQAGNVPINIQGSGSQTNLGTAASLGYEIQRWDLRAGLMSLDAGHATKTTGVMMSAALSFAQF